MQQVAVSLIVYLYVVEKLQHLFVFQQSTEKMLIETKQSYEGETSWK
jgi:hypothetical protein